ncbi:methyltransferase, TIGR04325 family [Variovorax boronicumulans]|nr:methyltransferase, TIGR04325 family [Variovorax boronicumulans]
MEKDVTHSSASQVVRQILEGPVTRPALLRWRRQQFLSEAGFGSYFGVFDSFAQARDWLPASPEFDHAALAAEYVDVRTKRVFPYDYPVMWWLDRAFRDGANRVLDIGGSVGVHFYAYRRYVEMPRDLSWRVVEVPAIASIGRDMVGRPGAEADGLSFTGDLEHVMGGGDDIWIAAGSLQYFENARPGELLRHCAVRPRYLLLNKLPLHDGQDYVTAQNIGAGCFSPVHVYNRKQYVEEIEARGYVLRDQWPVLERSLYLPGFPERCVPQFSGLYFVR